MNLNFTRFPARIPGHSTKKIIIYESPKAQVYKSEAIHSPTAVKKNVLGITENSPTKNLELHSKASESRIFNESTKKHLHRKKFKKINEQN